MSAVSAEDTVYLLAELREIGVPACIRAANEIERLRSELRDIADLPGNFFTRCDEPDCVIGWAKEALA